MANLDEQQSCKQSTTAMPFGTMNVDASCKACDIIDPPQELFLFWN